ncbi:hypothetical protein JI721_07275 [Alicyclobacillus cycloheptanicus]|jgi:hypothetical protein|uniref:Small CPxCG-related zinc finger protein n=1 Tax=Alicyclobacillus cycloheptanicus TaxID=1457 RepID=A0ABT9XJG9_9BACL|nr:hypothetical protein [Alicyclobacillus cycloheptanicus]MDQ0190189.1 hypothetical protein [Alicyclobacillus cycloheptanicus]WDM02561.1 hypothetical protein JI721_07275 [Alicyclobacillus cycloheptanicus]
MSAMKQATCPYCGDSWEIDLDAPELSDQDRIELDAEPVATVVCADCLDLHLHT